MLTKINIALAMMLLFFVGTCIHTFRYWIDSGVLITFIAIAVDTVIYLYCLNYIYKYKG